MTLSIGIDIGNQKCVVALYKDGVVDAVLNEEIKRETPTVVQFAHDHRLFGGACDRAHDPQSAIDQLKRLVIGFDNALDNLPYRASRELDSVVAVTVHYQKEDIQFTAVQMLAMLLLHMKRSAEGTVGSKISTCVVGIPAYSDERHREAYLEAAAIAGLGPCMLEDDGLATCTEYGIYRHTREAVNVVFVDIGHCNTQVTVARFVGENPKVLGRAWDGNLGGRDFDEIIYNYCLEELMRQYGSGYRNKLNVKGEVRLRAACEKAKKVLSVNRDAQISVDSLMRGESEFKVVITRDEFEKRSDDLLGKIEEKCHEALYKAGLKKGEIQSIELVGSGTRIPAISRVLSEFFQRELSRTLNGSECVARGSALRCEAMKKNLLVYAWYDLKYTWRMWRNTSIRKALLRENHLLKQDRAYKQASITRNKLESNIWRIRNELRREGRFENILMKIDEIEASIYNDKEEDSASSYDEKIEDINSLLDQNEIGHLKIDSSPLQQSEDDNEGDSLELWQPGFSDIWWKLITMLFICVWELLLTLLKLLWKLITLLWKLITVCWNCLLFLLCCRRRGRRRGSFHDRNDDAASRNLRGTYMRSKTGVSAERRVEFRSRSFGINDAKALLFDTNQEEGEELL